METPSLNKILHLRRQPLNRVKKNKSPREILFGKVWKACSEYVRRRDKGKCFTCSTKKEWKKMQAGHFRHGKSSPIYFNLQNVHCQCDRCNRLMSGQRDIYLREIQKKYGIEEGDYLIREGRKTYYYKMEELKRLLAYFKEKISQL